MLDKLTSAFSTSTHLKPAPLKRRQPLLSSDGDGRTPITHHRATGHLTRCKKTLQAGLSRTRPDQPWLTILLLMALDGRGRRGRGGRGAGSGGWAGARQQAAWAGHHDTGYHLLRTLRISD